MNNNYLIDINNINTAIIVLSKDHNIINLNQRAKDLFNWNEKNQNFIELCNKHKIDCPLNKKINETCINETSLRWEIKPIKNNEFILAGYDITELKQEQEKSFQLDSIIAKMPGNIYWYDEKFNALGCNENSAKSVGISREQFIGKNVQELRKISATPKPVIDEWCKKNKKIISNKIMNFDYELFPFKDKTGTIRHFLEKIVLLFDKKNEKTTLLGVSVDITDRKKAEKALRESKEANKAKNYFMTTMAQTMRNPIRATSAIFRLLTLDKLSKRQKKFLKAAVAQLDETQLLLQELLDYANIDAEEENKNVSLFDLKELLNSIYKNNKKYLQENKVKFVLNYETKAPNKIIGDKNCMQMLFDNLLATSGDLIDNGDITFDVIEQKCKETWEPEVILKISMHGVKERLASNQELFVTQLNGAEFLFQVEETQQ